MPPPSTQPGDHYQNFKVAVYCRVYEVRQMGDLDWLRPRYEAINRHVRVDKVYLETHRDLIVAEEDVLQQARQFFESRGVQVSGGITITVNERNRFETYCYTNPDHRQKLQELSTYTARLFDEVILDDFFFTNCKCAGCIQAKGERSWTDFRLDLMAEAARSLVIEPARLANPKVELVIKYPNWYEHFQGLGFNLEAEPPLFDRLYTGTETRDPVLSNQHLQPYHGYAIFRYFENLKPGANGGGWVDPFGSRNLDRYAEQLWLTLFAKAPEVTLFDFKSLQIPLQEAHRADWQGQGASFDFDRAVERQPDGTLVPAAAFPLAAGAAFALADRFLDRLGEPLGIKCYKPYHSTGEDFLHSYLGMLGLPIDLAPEFPAGAGTVLLTESAKHDGEIVAKIKRQLVQGKAVVITSGLLRALQERGLADIVELEHTGQKATSQQFMIGWNQVYASTKPILVPQIRYLTNDSWEEISCLAGVTGTPLLHSARYGGGTLYVLAIPDNFGDLYALPPEVLNRLREALGGDLPVRLVGPAQVALFVYDNDTFIVASFLPESVEVQAVVESGVPGITDLLSGEALSGVELQDWRGKSTGKKGYRLALKPHSFRVFQMERQP
jgi:hypothetical protein